jgi:phage terminase small subunit
MSAKWPPKQLRFRQEFLVDQNAAAAARRAGYSEKTASVIGYELLQKPHIAAAIAEDLKRLADKAGITAARIVEEIGRLAVGDLRDLHRADGSPLPIQEWPDHIAACVSSLEYETVIIPAVGEPDSAGYQEARPVTHIAKVRLWSKPEALRLAAQYHKLLTEKVTLGDINGSTSVVIYIPGNGRD